MIVCCYRGALPKKCISLGKKFVFVAEQVRLRRRATVEFSPAFQGRDRRANSCYVASATTGVYVSAVADATGFGGADGDPGLERPGYIQTAATRRRTSYPDTPSEDSLGKSNRGIGSEGIITPSSTNLNNLSGNSKSGRDYARSLGIFKICKPGLLAAYAD